jgi:Ser/Thr protein kinase RdoA (MazF antagonist)
VPMETSLSIEDLFFSLMPEKILEGVEAFGYRCTGRCIALNSMENRVYEVELDVDESLPKYQRYVVCKFYRPGRWTEAQINEEHQFLFDLAAQEIPVAAPLRNPAGAFLAQLPGLPIWYTVFPRLAGRNPQELSDEDLPWLGRLLARTHAIGAGRQANHRITLSTATYGYDNIEFLLTHGCVPLAAESRYASVARGLCSLIQPLLEGVPLQRIHGDCHLGNVMTSADGPALVDFDDMVVGPVVQDIWLVIPGRDLESQIQLDILLEAYDQMNSFPRSQLALIEPLRALRIIHYTAWIAKRWKDPAFKRAFTFFESPGYWDQHIRDLEELALIISRSSR